MWKILCLVIALMQTHALVEATATNLDIKGLENINGSVYYISPPGVSSSILEAVATCNDINMKLVSLQTEEKHNMITEFLAANEYTTSYWTSGLRLHGNETSSFIWSGTGELISDYTNWYSGQPSYLHLQNLCIFIDANKNYQWLNYNCDNVAHGIICEE